MLNKIPMNNFHECLKLNIHKITKQFLYVNLISIITLVLNVILLCLLIYIFSALPNKDINANQRTFWLIIFITFVIIIFIWLIFRLCAFTYGYLKIKRFNYKGDDKLAQINLWLKLVMLSLNHHYLYKILMNDIFLEKWHTSLNLLPSQQKQQFCQKTLLINMAMICNYSAWIAFLFVLGVSFNLSTDKYFWFLASLFVGYCLVKIALKIIFIYYLFIFKHSSNLSNKQFLNLISIMQKSHNNFFIYQLYLNFLK